MPVQVVDVLAAALRALGNAKPSIARSLLDLSRHRCWVLPIQVVDVLAAALRALGNAKPDVARGLLDLAVAVLVAGEITRTLAAGGPRAPSWEAAKLAS